MSKKNNVVISEPFKVQEKQEVFIIEEPHEVDGRTSILQVKIVVDCRKCTWKVMPAVTTLQIDPTNPLTVEATAEKVKLLTIQAVNYATERRAYWLQFQESGDPDQLSLGFDEE